MNNTPADPFSSINLDEFKKKTTSQPSALQRKDSIDTNLIKKIANQNEFQSRENSSIIEKEKVINKSFSLFQSECNIINDGIKNYITSSEDMLSQPSGSDVVRAALFEFAKLSTEEQMASIKEHRGRGRKAN